MLKETIERYVLSRLRDSDMIEQDTIDSKYKNGKTSIDSKISTNNVNYQEEASEILNRSLEPVF